MKILKQLLLEMMQEGMMMTRDDFNENMYV